MRRKHATAQGMQERTWQRGDKHSNFGVTSEPDGDNQGHPNSYTQKIELFIF